MQEILLLIISFFFSLMHEGTFRYALYIIINMMCCAHQPSTISENAIMTFIEINFKNPFENTIKFCFSFQIA